MLNIYKKMETQNKKPPLKQQPNFPNDPLNNPQENQQKKYQIPQNIVNQYFKYHQNTNDNIPINQKQQKIEPEDGILTEEERIGAERIRYLVGQNYRNMEYERQNAKLTLFFNYEDELLPINITADKLLVDALNEYKKISGKHDVVFIYKGIEINIYEHPEIKLYEFKRLESGDEIIVKDEEEWYAQGI